MRSPSRPTLTTDDAAVLWRELEQWSGRPIELSRAALPAPPPRAGLLESLVGAFLGPPRRPTPERLERALRRFEGAEAVVELISKIRADPGELSDLVDAFGSADWLDHLRGAYGILASEHRAELVYPRLRSPWVFTTPGHRQWAGHIADRIAGVNASLGRRAGQLVCATCLSRFRARHDLMGALPWDYGCRLCTNWTHFLEIPGDTVQVVDPGAPGRSLVEDELHVGWPAHRDPVDLDRVEIRAADDHAIETYVIGIRNDDDAVRRARYARAEAVVGPGLDLGPNSLALLDATFGTVRRS